MKHKEAQPLKMSEILDRFAGGYFGSGEDLEEMQDLLNIACIAWNIACLPSNEREAALEKTCEEFHRENPESDQVGDLLNDLRHLIERKDHLFPDLRRIVAHARIIPVDDMHFRVEAASLAPPEEGADPVPPAPLDRSMPISMAAGGGPKITMEEEHLDVLQTLEFEIVSTHREYPDMTDYAVMRVLEALIDRYKGQHIGRMARDWRPSELERILEQRLHALCEWRLGRLDIGDLPSAAEEEMKPIKVDEILWCLKRILKSVQRWNKEAGRQGYLTFIGHYIP